MTAGIGGTWFWWILGLVASSRTSCGRCTVCSSVCQSWWCLAVMLTQMSAQSWLHSWRAACLLIGTILWTSGFLHKINNGDFILVLKLKERILAGGGSSWLFHALQKMIWRWAGWCPLELNLSENLPPPKGLFVIKREPLQRPNSVSDGLGEQRFKELHTRRATVRTANWTHNLPSCAARWQTCFGLCVQAREWR